MCVNINAKPLGKTDGFCKQRTGHKINKCPVWNELKLADSEYDMIDGVHVASLTNVMTIKWLLYECSMVMTVNVVTCT